jgi:thiamine pyrophosphokinase
MLVLHKARIGPHFHLPKPSKKLLMTSARVLTSEFLKPKQQSPSPTSHHHRLALLILNWQLPPNITHLWSQSCINICADGGSNRLYDELPKLLPTQDPDSIRKQFLPHLIRGDLDSIRPEVKAFYHAAGVQIDDHSEDQDSTDFEKCVNALEEFKEWTSINHISDGGNGNGDDGPIPTIHGTQQQQKTIVALGAHGGRLDHLLSNLNALYKFRDHNIILMGEGNLTRLVKAGSTCIRPVLGREGPHCGLIPLQGQATVTTSGLKWDMERTGMRFGGLVSTSNRILGEEVCVESDSDLVWTTELSL